jgi:phosphoserine phosphatase
MSTDRLPSWKPGATRDTLIEFLDASAGVPEQDRVAYFDNDGTLWCERPSYVQLDFFLDALRERSAGDPAVADRPEYAALLTGDQAAVAELGMARIALALAELFEGLTPEEFTAHVVAFMDRAVHPTFGPMRGITYVPMLELIDELRRLEFTVGVVTGGGTEFVRAISADLYGVPPELVVGTLIEYEFVGGDGRPVLRRTARVLGDANEAAAKVTNIQTQLGRRPLLAAGNSAGDREMLEWALAGPHPGLAVLVDHDDDEREVAYDSVAGTFEATEPITAVAASAGWLTVSMARDWETVFATD